MSQRKNKKIQSRIAELCDLEYRLIYGDTEGDENGREMSWTSRHARRRYALCDYLGRNTRLAAKWWGYICEKHWFSRHQVIGWAVREGVI